MQNVLRTRLVFGIAALVIAAGTVGGTVIVDPLGHYITDPFNTDTSTSWKADTGSSVSFTYTATGGSTYTVPTGVPVNTAYLSVHDAQNASMVVVAPAQFGGVPWNSGTVDLHRFNNQDGIIYFDSYVDKIRGGTTAPLASFGVVVIKGNGLTASTDVGTLPVTGQVWARLNQPFQNTAWKVGADPNAVGATTISTGDWDLLLHAVDSITVNLSLAGSNSDIVAFDNFTITDVPEPATALLVLATFVLGAYFVRRNHSR